MVWAGLTALAGLGGLALWLIGRRQRLDRVLPIGSVVLTVVRPEQMTDADRGAWPSAFTHLSVKLLDGTRRFDGPGHEGRLELLAESTALGRPRCGWAWVYCRSPEEAEAEAIAAAEVINAHALDLWTINAEKPLARSTDPEGHALVYLDALRARTNGVVVRWNGLNGETTAAHYSDIPARPLTTARVLARCDAWAVMYYSNRGASLRRRVAQMAERVAASGVRPMLMVASGRKTETGATLAAREALAAECAAGSLAGVDVYLGDKGAGMVATGHDGHPPWTVEGPRLRALMLEAHDKNKGVA